MVLRCYFDEQDIDQMVFPDGYSRLLPDSYDVQKDLVPYFLEIAFEGQVAHIDKMLYAREIDDPIEKAIEYLNELIYVHIDSTIKGYNDVLNTSNIQKDNLDTFSKQNKIIDALVKKVDLEYYFEEIKHLICFFLACPDYIVHLNTNVPTKLILKIENAVKEGFTTLAQALDSKTILKEIEKIKFIQEGTFIKPITMPPNVVVKATVNDGVLVLFKDIDFMAKDQKFLHQIFQGVSPTQVETVMFHNCRFIDDISFDYDKCVNTPIVFRNCEFRNKMRFNTFFDYYILFKKCNFKGSMIFSDLKIGATFRFNQCFFEKDAQIWFTPIAFGYYKWEDPAERYNNYIFSIEDCIFLGNVRFTNSNFYHGTFILKNSTFFSNVEFKGVYFDKKTEISNISIQNTNDEIYKQNIFDLYESLENSGLQALADTLNLKIKEDKKFNLDIYKAELESGNVKSSAAAKYIGKSSGWLAHKRMQDKKEIRYDSIPFIGKGKNITYPVEALDAYKNHDWKKLKELRQKYPIPKDE